MSDRDEQADAAYAFVYRGHLAKQALGRAGYVENHDELDLGKIEKALCVELLDGEYVSRARRMAVVYVAIAAFENSLRKLVASTLREEVGEEWWETCVSDRIKKKALKRKQDEEKFRWHAQRGDNLLAYTDLPDLASVFLNNQGHFADLLEAEFEWVKQILHIMEKSRNVIMHSGELDMEDIVRLGINIRDWNRQVGL